MVDFGPKSAKLDRFRPKLAPSRSGPGQTRAISTLRRLTVGLHSQWHGPRSGTPLEQRSVFSSPGEECICFAAPLNSTRFGARTGISAASLYLGPGHAVRQDGPPRSDLGWRGASWWRSLRRLAAEGVGGRLRHPCEFWGFVHMS